MTNSNNRQEFTIDLKTTGFRNVSLNGTKLVFNLDITDSSKGLSMLWAELANPDSLGEVQAEQVLDLIELEISKALIMKNFLNSLTTNRA